MTTDENEYERQLNELHQEKDRYWEVPAGQVSQEEKERNYQEWLESIARSPGPERVTTEDKTKPKRGTGYRFDAEREKERLIESLEKQFIYQEMHVREHHPDWSEEQILAHLDKLRSEFIERQFGQKRLIKTNYNKKRR